MNAVDSAWVMANQRYMATAIELLESRLRAHLAGDSGTGWSPDDGAVRKLEEAAAALPFPAAIDTLGATFRLSGFERSILLICAGVELSTALAELCSRLQGGDPNRPHPTFGMALAVLDDAHWSALVPAAPLRRWRLVELGAGVSLTTSPLRIDERILHYLAGIQHLDERLEELVAPLPASAPLAASHSAIAERLAGHLAQRGVSNPIVQLCGVDHAAKRAIAAAAAGRIGLDIVTMTADAVPTAAHEEDGLRRLVDREAALSPLGLFLDAEAVDRADRPRLQALVRFAERVRAPLIVAATDPLLGQDPWIRLDVDRPSSAEQAALWRSVLGPTLPRFAPDLDGLVNQFDLGAQSIASAAIQVVPASAAAPSPPAALWDACRRQARPRLDDLAQRIEPRARWSDLVLPEPQDILLREIAAHTRHRSIVYERWGFVTKGTRGLGISALFAGPSGTGKTMAAEVLASELRLDLYHIDLSQVVSKYIGETEKNLHRVFDAAEEGGAILFFDEADALFGKRSEVRDSHDRYANIEVSYLLQRMEAYRGLAILTTNLKSALDQAFLRRIRFIVQFPFPDEAQRAEIWRAIFPAQTPTKDLDIEKLSRLNVTGGSIRNIALNAAFLAADSNAPVGMHHILRAARTEYAKLERPLTASEMAGWA